MFFQFSFWHFCRFILFVELFTRRRKEIAPKSLIIGSALQDEMIDFCTVVVLEDKEISMIERILGGKRAGGYSAYKHLSETCNLEDSFLRAYVKLGKDIDGHPVSKMRCGLQWACIDNGLYTFTASLGAMTLTLLWHHHFFTVWYQG